MADKKTWKGKWSLQTIFPFLGLILIVFIFSVLTKGKIFSNTSIKAMVNDGIYVLMGAIGFTFLFAMGCMDFSIGCNMCMSCSIACLAAQRFGIPAGIAAGILTGLLIGFANGMVVVYTGIAPLIATLGMMFILQGAVQVVLNGSVLQAPMSIMKLYTTPLKVTLILGFSVAGYLIFEKTVFGRIAKAIGAAPETVRQTGIHAGRYKVAAYMITGGIAGILGVVSLARTGSATASTGGSLMFNVLVAVLLGGMPITGGPATKFRGAVIGTLTISFLMIGMTLLRVSAQNQQLIKGLIFLVAIGICFDRKNMKVIK